MQIVAKDAADAKQISMVRTHLQLMRGRFEQGDYSGPAHIHGAAMPGLADLKALRSMFLGDTMPIHATQATLRGVRLLSMQDQSGSQALSSRGGTDDQGAKQGILAINLKPHERTRRAIGAGEEEMLKVRLGQVRGRKSFCLEQRDDA
jgi:hypothetical protein